MTFFAHFWRFTERHQSCSVARQFILLTLIGVLVLGCSSRPWNLKAVESWIGADEVSLIEAWGPPTSEETGASGQRILEWAQHSGADTLFEPAFLGGGTSIIIPVQIPETHCIARVMLTSEGIVEAANWSGDNCVSLPSRE